jgi:hypothetical protein
MKANAEILKFAGRELKAVSDISAVHEALMYDLIAGNITPAEAKKIQKEVDKRINGIKSALKTLEQWSKLQKHRKVEKF